MKMIGVDDQYADVGPYEELLAHLGLQGEQIADTVEQFLNMKLVDNFINTVMKFNLTTESQRAQRHIFLFAGRRRQTKTSML